MASFTGSVHSNVSSQPIKFSTVIPKVRNPIPAVQKVNWHNVSSKREEEGVSFIQEGIELDESGKISSLTIPSSTPSSKGISSSLKAISLPSSPVKTGMRRSIEELRAELSLMKELSYGHLSSADSGIRIESSSQVNCSNQRQRSDGQHSQSVAEVESNQNVRDGELSRQRMEVSHLKNKAFAFPDRPTPFQQVHGRLIQPQPQNSNIQLSGGKPAVDSDSGQKPACNPLLHPGNNSPYPPVISNFHSLPPGSSRMDPSSNPEDFPPLTGSKASLTQPTYSVSSSPKQTVNPNFSYTPIGPNWANLFNVNRMKENGLQLEHIQEPPLTNGPNPSISVTMEEVEDELARWVMLLSVM